MNCGGNSPRRLWLNEHELMPPLFRLYSNPFNSSGLDVVVVMRPKVIDKTITRSIMQSDSYCFIQHYNQHDDTCTRQELIHQTRAVRDRIPPPRRICSVSASGSGLRIWTRDPDYFQNVSGTSWSKDTYVIKIFMKIQPLFPEI